MDSEDDFQDENRAVRAPPRKAGRGKAKVCADVSTFDSLAITSGSATSMGVDAYQASRTTFRESRSAVPAKLPPPKPAVVLGLSASAQL